jgi:hypothetical protein
LLLPRGILWEVGPFVQFDMARHLLPHVAKKFSNIVESRCSPIRIGRRSR